MRFVKYFILLFIFIVGINSASGQNRQRGGVPYGIIYPEISSSISCSEFTPNSEEFKNEISEGANRGKDGIPMRMGFSVPAEVRIDQDYTFNIEGDRVVWQHRIISEGALALGLVFENFIIPDYGKLFIYSPDGQEILGYYDSESSVFSKPFVTNFISGDEVIVEYSEKASKQQFASGARISISEVIHLFRGVSRLSKGLGDSQWCQVNVNCPEGASWQSQKRGVAKMLFKKGSSWYNCTGTLVNNTNEDGKLYFLTADHCGGDATEEERSLWQFYFQFERPGCSNDEDPVNSDFVQGCSLVSHAPLSGGSDFQLVEISSPVSRSSLPYFNGWDISGVASKEGVSIHHPNGDVKKISTFTRTLTTTTPNVGGSIMAVNSAWRVYWDETETNFGVTEPGSSGAPLFDTCGLIIGTLAGGNSSCSNPSETDFYGKFSYHWDSNGEENDQQLSHWLNPDGVEITALNGFDPLVPKNLSAVVEQKVVTLSWEEPLFIDGLSGYKVFSNDEEIAQLSSAELSYQIDYNSKADYCYYVTAVYSSPDYESDASNKVFASIDTDSHTILGTEKRVKIYPNPAKDQVVVESDIPMNSIAILSVSGVEIENRKNPEGSLQVIFTLNIPNGVYFVNIILIDGGREVLKLVVSH
ncbi:MAG TPA: T9SS type A sorting domain-containing protein [Tenuifilaceae bacterium]|nr:T9SS type A sorting domain-containing protein [Tenuifilaceae bacterium]